MSIYTKKRLTWIGCAIGVAVIAAVCALNLTQPSMRNPRDQQAQAPPPSFVQQGQPGASGIAGSAMTSRQSGVGQPQSSGLTNSSTLATGNGGAAQGGVTSTLPAPVGPLHSDPPPGDRAVATVSLNGERTTMVPDHNGDFPRMLIKPQAALSIQLNFPDGSPGDRVAVEEEDGGVLDNKNEGEALTLDGQNNINFTFQANSAPGIYRVVVRDSGVLRTVNFWVGPELPIANR